MIMVELERRGLKTIIMMMMMYQGGILLVNKIWTKNKHGMVPDRKTSRITNQPLAVATTQPREPRPNTDSPSDYPISGCR